MTDRFKILKNEYKVHIKISLIISLSLIIVLFIIFPKISPPPPYVPVYQSLIITINDLTQNTVQSTIENPKPPEPKIIIPNTIEDPEALPDEKIFSILNNSNPGNGNNVQVAGNESGLDAPILPFVPKQILEVLPHNSDEDINGYVEIKLKIGTNGKVIEYKVIANTTGSQKYLQSVIDAAYKSRWEPIKINNDKIVYWVEKTYTFK
jgi:hypothetical protein